MKIRKTKKASGNSQFLSLDMLAAVTGMTLVLALDAEKSASDTIHPAPSDYASIRIQVVQNTQITQKTSGNSYAFTENDDNSSTPGKIFPMAPSAEKPPELEASLSFEQTTRKSVNNSGQSPAAFSERSRHQESRGEPTRDATKDSEPILFSWDRMESASRLERELSDGKLRVWEMAQTQGWTPVGAINEDSGYERMAIENSSVYTCETSNKDAAISTAAREAIAGTSVPIDGDSQTAGV